MSSTLLHGNGEPLLGGRALSFGITPRIDLSLGGDLRGYPLPAMAMWGEYALPGRPSLTFGGEVAYAQPSGFSGVSILSLGVRSAAAFPVRSRLHLKGTISGGLSLFYDGNFNAYPLLTAGVDLRYQVSAGIRVATGVALIAMGKLSRSIGLSIDVSYHLPTRTSTPDDPIPQIKPLIDAEVPAHTSAVELRDIRFEPIFPVLYKRYDDQAIGTAVLYNGFSQPIRNIHVRLLVKRYMDSPRDAQVASELNAGDRTEVEFPALFSNQILEITEGTKVSADITIEYTVDGVRDELKLIETMRILDRNAITWDDDQKVSAFVTAKDPTVLRFAKFSTGILEKMPYRLIDKNLLSAIAVHEALTAYGIRYAVDPKTPYIELSQSAHEVDYLQFPRQTLEYQGGDCDDLATLYSALLEAVGIETAFITVPAHLYMAFALSIDIDEALRTFSYLDDLIIRNGKVWVPVEITERSGGFLNAWQTGAKRWREHESRNQTGFFPTHESWATYEPVGFVGAVNEMQLPEIELLRQEVGGTIEQLVDREIEPRIQQLEAEIERTQGSASAINRLGVLFARYGLFERSTHEFERAPENPASFLNLGHVHYLQGEVTEAFDYYERARALAPDDLRILLALVRVNHEVENYETASELYNVVLQLDPELAERHSYLAGRGDSGVRSDGAQDAMKLLIWADE